RTRLVASNTRYASGARCPGGGRGSVFAPNGPAPWEPQLQAGVPPCQLDRSPIVRRESGRADDQLEGRYAVGFTTYLARVAWLADSRDRVGGCSLSGGLGRGTAYSGAIV